MGAKTVLVARTNEPGLPAPYDARTFFLSVKAATESTCGQSARNVAVYLPRHVDEQYEVAAVPRDINLGKLVADYFPETVGIDGEALSRCALAISDPGVDLNLYSLAGQQIRWNQLLSGDACVSVGLVSFFSMFAVATSRGFSGNINLGIPWATSELAQAPDINAKHDMGRVESRFSAYAQAQDAGPSIGVLGPDALPHSGHRASFLALMSQAGYLVGEFQFNQSEPLSASNVTLIAPPGSDAIAMFEAMARRNASQAVIRTPTPEAIAAWMARQSHTEDWGLRAISPETYELAALMVAGGAAVLSLGMAACARSCQRRRQAANAGDDGGNTYLTKKQRRHQTNTPSATDGASSGAQQNAGNAGSAVPSSTHMSEPTQAELKALRHRRNDQWRAQQELESRERAAAEAANMQAAQQDMKEDACDDDDEILQALHVDEIFAAGLAGEFELRNFRSVDAIRNAFKGERINVVGQGDHFVADHPFHPIPIGMNCDGFRDDPHARGKVCRDASWMLARAREWNIRNGIEIRLGLGPITAREIALAQARAVN